MASPPERDEYVEYISGSGAITCRVLYRTEQLAFVLFRTIDWPGYKDFGNYAQVALFSEHLRPADPRSPGVVGFTQAIAREVAAQQRISPIVDIRRTDKSGWNIVLHTQKSRRKN